MNTAISLQTNLVSALVEQRLEAQKDKALNREDPTKMNGPVAVFRRDFESPSWPSK